MCTANATPAEMSATAAVSTSAEMSAAATTSPATMASTSAMTSASSAAAFCVSSACKNGGQEDNGTEFEFWHGNLERAPPRVTDENDSVGR
jgi:hypothetical protein